MGSLCSKICPWFNKNSQPESIEDKELNRINDEDITGDYKMLGGEEENLNELDDLHIKLSQLVIQRDFNPEELYENIKELGSGSFGEVRKVRHKKSGVMRAMKIIKKESFDEEKLSEIEKEVEILKRMDHPNILKIFESFQDEKNFYIVTELCEHGDLFDKLEQMRTMNELTVKVLMYQILSAVAYLHSKGIIHGDMKLENILIDNLNIQHRNSFKTSVNLDIKMIESMESTKLSAMKSGVNSLNATLFKNMSNFEIKIIDFGCSKMFGSGKKKLLSGLIGTSMYCSPEVIRNQYNEKCDIWACGVIMYVLLCGFPPFEGETDEDIFKDVIKGKLNFDFLEFDKVSGAAIDLLKKLLTYNGNKRPSAKEALQDSFFSMNPDTDDTYIKSIDSSPLSTLKKYKGSFKFQQAVLAFLSHNFANQEEVQRLRKLFKFLDKNGDGTISKEELKQGYKSLGEEISEETIDIVIKAIDNDGDGFVEYEEFIRASHCKQLLLTEQNLRLAFDLFDMDKSGEISCEEVKKIIFGKKNVSDKVLTDFLGQINKKETDLITFEEFKMLMTQNQN